MLPSFSDSDIYIVVWSAQSLHISCIYAVYFLKWNVFRLLPGVWGQYPKLYLSVTGKPFDRPGSENTHSGGTTMSLGNHGFFRHKR